jgi:hypothetical protein
MSEIELQRDGMAAADLRGLLWHHCPRNVPCQGNRGFPDLVIAGPRGLLLTELKSATGETSPDQDLWAWTIQRGSRQCSSAGYRLWNPRHWEEAVIHRELDTIA